MVHTCMLCVKQNTTQLLGATQCKSYTPPPEDISKHPIIRGASGKISTSKIEISNPTWRRKGT